jgi:hypothetical protein
MTSPLDHCISIDVVSRGRGCTLRESSKCDHSVVHIYHGARTVVPCAYPRTACARRNHLSRRHSIPYSPSTGRSIGAIRRTRVSWAITPTGHRRSSTPGRSSRSHRTIAEIRPSGSFPLRSRGVSWGIPSPSAPPLRDMGAFHRTSRRKSRLPHRRACWGKKTTTSTSWERWPFETWPS